MNEEIKPENMRIHSRADELISCLEGEIAKRDVRIEAQEDQINILQSDANSWQSGYDEGRRMGAKHAAPVSEAKAQGVVQWPEADEIMQMAFEEGQPADDASGYCFELEEFDLFIERLMSEVARLNASPAAPAADAGLVEALETIINPIEAMRRELQEGERLNGMVAMQLASDPEYLRGVARAALAAHRAKGVV